jgi:hypothetical protein
MPITYNSLAANLPPASLEFVGNNQVKLNFSSVTGQTGITPDSPVFMGVVKFLQALADATSAINAERSAQNPPLPPIAFCSQALEGTPQKPEYHFAIVIAVDSTKFIETLVDPTV